MGKAFTRTRRSDQRSALLAACASISFLVALGPGPALGLTVNGAVVDHMAYAQLGSGSCEEALACSEVSHAESLDPPFPSRWTIATAGGRDAWVRLDTRPPFEDELDPTLILSAFMDILLLAPIRGHTEPAFASGDLDDYFEFTVPTPAAGERYLLKASFAKSADDPVTQSSGTFRVVDRESGQLVLELELAQPTPEDLLVDLTPFAGHELRLRLTASATIDAPSDLGGDVGAGVGAYTSVHRIAVPKAGDLFAAVGDWTAQALYLLDPATRSMDLVFQPQGWSPDPASFGRRGDFRLGLEFDPSGVVLSATDWGIYRIDTVTGTATLLPTAMSLGAPYGLALADSETAFVADALNDRILRVDLTTGATAVISEGGLLADPRGVAIEADGSLIATSHSTGLVVRIDAATGAQTLLTSGRLLLEPGDVEIAENGDIIVAEANDHTAAVIRIDPITGSQSRVTSFSPGATAADVEIQHDGSVFVAETGSGDVVHVDAGTGAQTPVVSGHQFARLAVVPPQCSDGRDNDGDGAADFPDDADCDLASAPVEAPACGDRLDNDADGTIDSGDSGCAGPLDDWEGIDCSDGVDNDGDGRIDYPDDPGCRNRVAGSEAPQCDDGRDNDGDGLGDDLDPECGGTRWWEDESRARDGDGGCGLGFELALVMPVLMWLRRRRARLLVSLPVPIALGLVGAPFETAVSRSARCLGHRGWGNSRASSSKLSTTGRREGCRAAGITKLVARRRSVVW